MGTPSVVETRESAKPAQWRLTITFWLDVTLLVSVCALQTVSFTGLVLHEWLGLAMVGMVLAHLLFAWSWIASQSRRLFAVQSARARINYLSQPESFRRRHRRDLLRHSDIAEGDSDVDRHESLAGHGLALGYPSQPVLAGRGHSVGVSPGDQLGLGARGRTEGFPPRPGRRAVKLVRVLSRLALLSLAAAAFVGLTGIYGDSVRPPVPNPHSQAARRYRPSAPQVGRFPEFVGEGMLLAFFAVVGRIALRLRLSPVSRSEGQPILLDLHRGPLEPPSVYQ